MNHLSPETVAAYVDRALSPDERARADAHLADCVECRSEVREVRGMVGKEVAAGRPWRLAGGLGLAAAAVAALMLLPSGTPPGAGPATPDVDANPLRSDAPGAVGLAAIQPLAPRIEAEPAGPSVTLRWRRADGASTYRVTLTDEAGATLWSSRTADTTALVPAHVELRPGATYFWFVDATRADGASATSGIQVLEVE